MINERSEAKDSDALSRSCVYFGGTNACTWKQWGAEYKGESRWMSNFSFDLLDSDNSSTSVRMEREKFFKNGSCTSPLYFTKEKNPSSYGRKYRTTNILQKHRLALHRKIYFPNKIIKKKCQLFAINFPKNPKKNNHHIYLNGQRWIAGTTLSSLQRGRYSVGWPLVHPWGSMGNSKLLPISSICTVFIAAYFFSPILCSGVRKGPKIKQSWHKCVRSFLYRSRFADRVLETI